VSNVIDYERQPINIALLSKQNYNNHSHIFHSLTLVLSTSILKNKEMRHSKVLLFVILLQDLIYLYNILRMEGEEERILTKQLEQLIFSSANEAPATPKIAPILVSDPPPFDL